MDFDEDDGNLVDINLWLPAAQANGRSGVMVCPDAGSSRLVKLGLWLLSR